jgi:DNA-binding PadR family transcriptional regulator
MKRTRLTELEECTVGLVWRDGPMTAYEIARTFATSLSSYWSGSAGAIYPMVKGLQRRGLIKGKRSGRRMLFEVTPGGLRAIRDWLRPPFAPSVGGPTFDPVRTRLFFLGALPRSQWKSVIDGAVDVVSGELARANEKRKSDLSSGNVSEALGALGVVYELRARLQWLRKVRTLLRDEKFARGLQ